MQQKSVDFFYLGIAQNSLLLTQPEGFKVSSECVCRQSTPLQLCAAWVREGQSTVEMLHHPAGAAQDSAHKSCLTEKTTPSSQRSIHYGHTWCENKNIIHKWGAWAESLTDWTCQCLTPSIVGPGRSLQAAGEGTLIHLDWRTGKHHKKSQKMLNKWNKIDVFVLFGDNASTLRGKKWMPTIFKRKLSKICWFLVLECEDLLMFFVIFMTADEKFFVLGLLAGQKKQFEDVMLSIFHNFLTFTRLND